MGKKLEVNITQSIIFFIFFLFVNIFFYLIVINLNKFKCLIALLITNMSSPPIILFDFDGVIISQKALEYTASIFRKKKFYRWACIENLRLIDFARLFEEADSKNRIKAFMKIIKI